jgi:ABC-type multidrug transport system fused ATPase/permease subunit
MKTWIAAVIRRYRKPLTLVVLIQLGCGLLVSLQPRYYQQIVSLAMDQNQADIWARGLPLLGWLAGLYLGIAVLQGISGHLGSLFSNNLLQQLQTDFFEKTSHLPLEYFQRRSAGEFFTTFANDIGQAQRFFAAFLPGVAREFITTTTVTAILFYFCPASLTLAALGIVCWVALLVAILNRVMGQYAKSQRAGWSQIHRVFDETVQGIDTLKVLGAERRRSADFHFQTGALRDLSVRAGRVLSVFSPAIDLLAKLGGLGLIATAYYLISKERLSTEPFLLFFFYATLLQLSISNLINSAAGLPTEFTGVRHLAAFLGERDEPDEGHLSGEAPRSSVAIELSGVSFGYPGGRRLYSKACLTIPANSITVVHGPSGSGKSTLINLLLRFFEPDEGRIMIGTTDIRQIPRVDLRKTIGVVTQHHFIFQETLRANLMVAQPDANDAHILQALERAQLSDFLARLPRGLDTVLDPGGRGISAGEKQRICIARLLLRESPIMILDEPWSNLDEAARDLLAAVLNSSKARATILILSHERLRTLSVERVYCLDMQQGIFTEN